jgi:hypothetical protein
MSIDLELGRHLRRDACRPVEPRIAFGPGQSIDVGDGLRAIDQIAFESRQARSIASQPS